MTARIEMRLEGGLKLTEQLKALALPPRDKRRLHQWMARDMARALKKQIRKHVRQSPLELYHGSKEERAYKARFFSRTVGYRANADHAVVYDKGLERFRRLSEGATEAQAEKLRKLGFQLSKSYILRRFTYGLAGLLIREMEQKLKRRKPKLTRRGSLLLMVWRVYGQRIREEVNLDQIVRRFLKAQLKT